jgi:IMP dehydrogenase
MGNVLDKIKNNNKSLLVIDTDNFLKGIITQRDLIYFNSVGNRGDPVVDFMTNITKMVTIERSELKNLSIPALIKILTSNKIQKLPIIENGELHGLITLKDMIDRSVNSIFKPNLDKNSQLIVGCAIGVNKDYLERARKVIDAGCDIICIDVAHGHHKLCGDAVRKIKSLHPHTSIIAGNVCTAEGVEYLASCGADCVKVGIGPGGICITRKQTGCGAPQLTSVLKCAKKAKELGITVIADGGHNGCIGNIFKALCCGSSASMLGGMLSGTLETPGQIYTKLDRKVKQIRGMAGIMSNYNKAEKLGQSTNNLETMTPEGVEGYVTYKGPVKDIINQICGGLRSGLSYVGCGSLENLNSDEIEFILITQSGYQESGSHGISEI